MMEKVKDAVIPDEVVTDKIYFIRGYKVMLDKDLAGLYGVKAIRLREQVKRNQDRFPANYMFQLTDQEVGGWYRKMRYHQKNILGAPYPMLLRNMAY